MSTVTRIVKQHATQNADGKFVVKFCTFQPDQSLESLRQDNAAWAAWAKEACGHTLLKNEVVDELDDLGNPRQAVVMVFINGFTGKWHQIKALKVVEDEYKPL